MFWLLTSKLQILWKTYITTEHQLLLTVRRQVITYGSIKLKKFKGQVVKVQQLTLLDIVLRNTEEDKRDNGRLGKNNCSELFFQFIFQCSVHFGQSEDDITCCVLHNLLIKRRLQPYLTRVADQANSHAPNICWHGNILDSLQRCSKEDKVIYDHLKDSYNNVCAVLVYWQDELGIAMSVCLRNIERKLNNLIK